MKRKFLLPVFAFVAVVMLFFGCTTDIDSETTKDAELSLNSSVLSISGAVATVSQAKLTASLSGSSSIVKWASSDASVVTVTNDGTGVTTLTAMGTGSARVVAATADGKLSASCKVTVTLSATAAHPVTNLQVNTITSTSAVLTWTDSSDLTAVKIVCYKTTDLTTVVAAATVDAGVQTAAVTGLTTDNIGVNYTFNVYGIVNNSNVSAVTTVTATTLPDTTPPEEVTGLVVSSYTAHSMTLTWTDPSDEDFDHVVVSSAGTLQDGSTAISSVNVAKGRQSVSFSKLAANTTYLFTVKTVDVNSNVSTGTSSASTSTSADTTAPSDVTGVSVTVNSITSVTLNWTDPADADFKNVVISTASATSGITVPDDVTVTAGTKTATIIVTADADYTFTLKAEDYDANKSAGINATASTKPLASGVSAAFAYNGQAVKITWADATAVQTGEAYTYTVTAAISGGTSVGSVTSIATGTQKATFTGLTAGTSYTFVVTTVRGSDSATYNSDDTTITVTATTLNAVTISNQNNSGYLLASSSTSIIASSSTSSSSYSDVWIVRPALDGTSTFTYSTESTTVSTFSLEATDLNGLPTGEYLYLSTVSSSNTSWTTASAALGSKSAVATSYSTLASFFLGSISYSSGNYTKCIRLTSGSGYFMLGINSTSSGAALNYRCSTGLPGVAQAHWYYNQISTAN